MFSFLIPVSAAATAAYTSKKICDADAAVIGSGEERSLLPKPGKNGSLSSTPVENSKNPTEHKSEQKNISESKDNKSHISQGINLASGAADYSQNQAEDDFFTPQMTQLLKLNKFKIACNVIEVKLKEATNPQDINKIITFIDQVKQKARDNTKMFDLFLFGPPSIILDLEILLAQAQDQMDKLKAACAPPKLPSAYGATQG